MTVLARLASGVAAAVVGALVGALVVLGASSLSQPAQPTAPKPGGEPSAPIASPGRRVEVLLAWAVGGMPATTERTLEDMPGVLDATTVKAGLDWLVRSRAPDGSVVDDPRANFALPFEMAVVEPAEYARFVAPSERPALRALRPNDVLLAATEAGLRRGGPGLQLELKSGTRRAAAVLSDVATNGYEGLIAGPVPSTWERVDRFVLAHVRVRARALRRVERRLEVLIEPGRAARIRLQGEQPFLRYGDSVQPQMLIKEEFGEFAAKPLADGTIEIEPRWRAENIRTKVLPLLGSVTCHRALFPQLESALGEAVSTGLAGTVDTFGGCYAPRFISRDPEGRLSHHSWGIALDINVGENAFGTKADQDERLVEVMRRWGFTWGGRWLVPDGMHFEWLRWP